MKIKLIMLLMMIMVYVSLVCAEIDLGVTKQHDCVQLYQSCPTCTYSDVRIIKYPDGTINNIDVQMTKNNTDFNYTFCTTEQLGIYTYTVYGNKGGLSYESTEEGTFNVTPSGTSSNPTFFFVILILSVGVIIFGFYLRDAPITILGSFGLYFFGIYLLYYGIDGIKDGVTTWAFGLIVLGLAFYISTRSTYELITD